MSHPVVHWEIGGHDLPGLREFYAKVFGWMITDAGPGYALVHPADGGFGGGLMQNAQGTPPYVTVYIQVDDLDVALGHVRAYGGTPLVPPTPINESAAFALFRDPEGNIVGLLRMAETGIA